MLGQPIYMLMPEVVGMKLTGALAGRRDGDRPGAHRHADACASTAWSNKFVEFYGDGVSTMSLADRATIANMAPEYGATMGFFPIDAETLRYLRRTGRTKAEVELVERYAKEQGLFRTDATPAPTFTSTLELDLSTVEPCLAGPKRPQDRMPLSEMKAAWRRDLLEVYRKESPERAAPGRWEGEGGQPVEPGVAKPEPAAAVADPGFDGVEVQTNGKRFPLQHGSVVIAAITSCTNTSNPSVMVAAGLRGEEGGREGAQGSAAREDEPRAGQPRGDRLLREGGARRRTSTSSASTPSATAARRASATAGRCPSRSPRR